MRSWVEYYIARRTSKRGQRGNTMGRHGSPEGRVMSRVATFAVALSVAVMILTLAIILGFKSEVRSRLTLLSGDVIVASTAGVTPQSTISIRHSERVQQEIIRIAQESGGEPRQIAPYVTRGAIINNTEGLEGVLLKGVDSLFDLSIIERGLIEGEVPPFGRGKMERRAVISQSLAAELKLKLNSRLELLIYDQEREQMRRDLYRVGAIYTQGLGEMERGIVMVDMRSTQRLNGWAEDEISGYELSLSNPSKSIEIANRVNDELLYSDLDSEALEVAAYATERLYPSIFDWLAALDMNGVVVLTIMTIVAIFNIITAILILVLERMQMVGVLKALGMTNGSISRIFLFRATKITLWGLFWGNIAGVALALIQSWWEPIKLDEAGYLLSAVPIELEAGWLVLLNVGVVTTILLSTLLPTRLVSSIEPHKAIKFQ